MTIRDIMNNKKYYRSFYFILIICICIVRCTPDYTKFTPEEVFFETIDDLYTNISNYDTFTYDATKEILIEYDDVLINFDASSFVDATTGQNVEGKIAILLKAQTKPGYFIIEDKQSLAWDGDFIQNYLNIEIKVLKNDNLLILKGGNKAKVYWKSDVLGPITKLYTFSRFQSQDMIGWDANQIVYDKLQYAAWDLNYQGINFEGEGYFFETKLDWTSLGALIPEMFPNAEYNELEVVLKDSYYHNGEIFNLSENFDQFNTEVFVILSDLNHISKAEFIEGKWILPRVMLNQKVKIIAISEMGNNFFIAKKEFENVNDLARFSLSPLPTIPENIVEELLSL